MRESSIETKFVKQVNKLGGLAYKFVSPGCRGVPDRLVLWLCGTVHFVELKTVKGRLSRVQHRQHMLLTKYNQKVFTIYGALGLVRYFEQQAPKQK